MEREDTRETFKVNYFYARYIMPRPKKDIKLATAISSNLKKLREKKFGSFGDMRKMCRAIGVTPQTWNKWEAGTSIPSDSNQRKIAKVFEVSVGELRNDTPTPSSPVFHPSEHSVKELIAVRAALLEQVETLNKLIGDRHEA